MREGGHSNIMFFCGGVKYWFQGMGLIAGVTVSVSALLFGDATGAKT